MTVFGILIIIVITYFSNENIVKLSVVLINVDFNSFK